MLIMSYCPAAAAPPPPILSAYSAAAIPVFCAAAAAAAAAASSDCSTAAAAYAAACCADYIIQLRRESATTRSTLREYTVALRRGGESKKCLLCYVIQLAWSNIRGSMKRLYNYVLHSPLLGGKGLINMFFVFFTFLLLKAKLLLISVTNN